jgi:putative endonuclease
VLRSDKDKNLYTGYTNDIKKRVKEHNEGKVTSTKNRVPLRLIYFEALYWFSVKWNFE